MILMTILYHGKIDSLRGELARAKPYLDEKYEQVLGRERVMRVAEVAKRTLGSFSFFDDTKEISRVLKTDFPETTPNKFMMANDIVNKDGSDSRDRFEPKKIRTAPAFYISDTGTQNSSYKNILHSYVHEYNHFVWYALQRVPLYLAIFMQKVSMEGSESREAWISRILKDLVANSSKSSVKERIDGVFTVIYADLLNDHYEKSNRVLDRLVLSSIGIDVDLEWRGQPREYHKIPIIGGPAIGMPVGGDPYSGLSDNEIINRTIAWENHIRLTTDTDYTRKFMGMLRETKVSRLSLEEIKEMVKLKRK
jgi:hypothetical protein